MHTISRYTFVKARPDGTWLAYNSRSGALAVVQEAVANVLCGRQDRVEALPNDVATSLLEQGFITTGDDERTAIARQFEDRKADLSSFSFTIVPTMACNFRCSYCYQEHDENKRIPKRDLDERILAFFDVLAAQGAKSFSLTWFGGEPLLGRPMVLRLTTALANRCADRAMRFAGASMITNGELLSEETAVALKAAGVSRVQISFDSLTYEHRLKRGVQNEDGSPSPILANAIAASKHLIVSIRLNVTRESEPYIDAMRARVERAGLGKNCYLARVHNESNGKSWADEANDETISVAQFAALQDAKAPSEEIYVKGMMNLLKPKQHYCGATRLTMFSIDNNGDVSRCWHSVGLKTESLFNLYDTAPADLTTLIFKGPWAAYNPTQFQSCANCKVLPLCMGGCSHGRNEGINPHSPCESIKFRIERGLEFIAENVAFDVS